MIQKMNEWERAVNSLVSLYRDVERHHLLLPAFSLAPFGIYMWNVLKWTLCLYLDLLLLIPMSTVIFLRNLFPGRWSYRSFSWRYIKYVLLWIWRGEAPSAPLVVIRPLTASLMVGHFRSRLTLLRDRITLEDSLSPEERDLLLSNIDSSLMRWRRHSILSVTATYVLPSLGPLIEFYRFLKPNLPTWTGTLVLFLVSYTVAFVVSSLMIQRGLMLGGSGRSSYFPGALDGPGAYADEDHIFQSLGIGFARFPLDIVLTIVTAPLGYFLAKRMFPLYAWLRLPSPTQHQLVKQTVLMTALFVGVGVLAFLRRRKLRRG